MRIALLLLPLLCVACLDSRQPYSASAEIHDGVEEPAPAPLVVRQRLDLGGRALDVVASPEAVFVATGVGVDVFPTGEYEPVESLVTPGRPVELLLDGDTLWVAAGYGGLVRVAHPLDAHARQITAWEAPDDLRALARQGRWLWAALEDGRLLVIPADAPAGASFETVAVDGWPAELVPFDDGVLVSASSGGLHAAQVGPDGRPHVVGPPFEEGYATAALPVDDDLYVNTFTGLYRHSLRDDTRVKATQRVKDIQRLGDGIVAAAGKEGLLEWDGLDPEVKAHPLALEGLEMPVLTVALAVLDDDHVVVAADDMGVFWMARTPAGWAIEHRHRYLGRIEALAWVDDRLAVGLTGPETAAVLFLDRDEHGAWSTGDSVEIPMDINGMVQAGRELLVAGVGVHVVQLDDLASGAVDTGQVDGSIEGLVLLSSGRVVGLQKEQSVTWLERSPSGEWAAVGRSPTGHEFLPMNVTSLGERVAVGYGGYGRLKIYDTPGDSWTDHVILEATATHRDGPYMRPAGVRSALGKFWVTCPYLGVESVDPETLETSLLRVAPGVADVCEYGDLLGAALSWGGAGVIDPAAPEAPLVAHVDLPGDARVVLADGEELIVASGGTLFVVEPALKPVRNRALDYPR